MQPSDLHFRRIQADATPGNVVTVFACEVATLPGDRTVDGKWLSSTVELTAEEIAMNQAIIDRAKIAIALKETQLEEDQ